MPPITKVNSPSVVQTSRKDDVLAHFNGRIARFKHPKDVVFVEALPRNALGKIVAAEVRALLG